MAKQMDMSRRLLGNAEYHRQRAAGVRAVARELAIVEQIQIIAADTGVPLSTVSQRLTGSKGREVTLTELSRLAESDTDLRLGNAVAALWGCEMVPLPDRSPATEQAIRDLEQLRDQVVAAIERARGGK